MLFLTSETPKPPTPSFTIIEVKPNYELDNLIMERNSLRNYDACQNVELKQLSIAIDTLPALN